MNLLACLVPLSIPFALPSSHDAPVVVLEARASGQRGGPRTVPAASEELLSFDLAVRCAETLPPGAWIDVEIEAFCAEPGGPSQAVGGSCIPSPFNAVNTHRENEVVVALHNGLRELRVFEVVNDAFVPRYSVDVPAHIEAIDIDDADNDGLNEILVGLGSASAFGPVRLYRHDPIGGGLIEEIVVADLPLKVEDLEIGDADNDGENEVVVGLERVSSNEPGLISRVVMFDYVNGAWAGPIEISAPEDRSAQDVAIADVDGDGLNEVVALFSNPTILPPYGRQVRTYELVGHQWVREDVSQLIGSFADRMMVADVDQDDETEIIIGPWAGMFGGLITYEPDGAGGWESKIIDGITGPIDALDIGDYDADGRPEIIAGTYQMGDAVLCSWEFSAGAWEDRVELSDPNSPTWHRDVAVGDADNEGCLDLLGAWRDLVQLYEAGNTQPVAEVSFPMTVDSVQVGDIDNDAIGSTIELKLRPSETCKVPFRLRCDAPPGSSWDLTFRATAVVRGAGDAPKRAQVSSRAIRVDVAR